MMRDYVNSLDHSEPNEGQTYQLKVMPQRKRANPEMDYTKLVFMVFGAVVAGIVYDRAKRR